MKIISILKESNKVELYILLVFSLYQLFYSFLLTAIPFW